MKRYRIVKKIGGCSGRTYYIVQKKFLCFWYHPDKEGCSVVIGEKSTTPRQHETIESAQESIKMMGSKRPKYKPEIVGYYD